MSVTCVYYLQSIQFVIEGLTFVSPSSNTVTFLLLCTTQGFSAEEYVRCLVTSIPINNSHETIPCVHAAYSVESTRPEFAATQTPTKPDFSPLPPLGQNDTALA